MLDDYDRIYKNDTGKNKAILEKIDPSPVKSIDYVKKRVNKTEN